RENCARRFGCDSCRWGRGRLSVRGRGLVACTIVGADGVAILRPGAEGPVAVGRGPQAHQRSGRLITVNTIARHSGSAAVLGGFPTKVDSAAVHCSGREALWRSGRFPVGTRGGRAFVAHTAGG